MGLIWLKGEMRERNTGRNWATLAQNWAVHLSLMRLRVSLISLRMCEQQGEARTEYLFHNRVSFFFFSHSNMCNLPRLLSGKTLRKKREESSSHMSGVTVPYSNTFPVCPLPSLLNKPLVLQTLWGRLLAIGFFNRRESHVCPRDLLFSEPHLWRNGFTGVPSVEEWRSAPTLEMSFAARCIC